MKQERLWITRDICCKRANSHWSYVRNRPSVELCLSNFSKQIISVCNSIIEFELGLTGFLRLILIEASKTQTPTLLHAKKLIRLFLEQEP
jgi:hypothetical protein